MTAVTHADVLLLARAACGVWRCMALLSKQTIFIDFCHHVCFLIVTTKTRISIAIKSV